MTKLNNLDYYFKLINIFIVLLLLSINYIVVYSVYYDIILVYHNQILCFN